VAQGEHPKLIADRLGHSSPIVTMTQYAHLFPGLDEEAAERLDRLRDGPQTDPGGIALLQPHS
jgi:integrase